MEMLKIRRGLAVSSKKVLCGVVFVIVFYVFISTLLKRIKLIGHLSYSEKQLLLDLSACKNRTKTTINTIAYAGYTHPCDIYGINKEAYTAALSKRASKEGIILLAMVDYGSLDFSINFYETSLLRQGVDNYLFISVDKRAYEELIKRQIACHLYKVDKDASHDSVYYSRDFLRKMNYRTFIILDALRLGYTVLHSDVDMFFFENPFNKIYCEKDECDMAMLNDYNMAQDKDTFNAGFVFMHPNAATIEVYKHMAWMAFHMKLDDQLQLNQAILEVMGQETGTSVYEKDKSLVVFYLKKESFLSGSYFWKDGEVSFFGDKTWPNPVVVHNNWMVSLVAKEYRFKEMQMWMYDKDAYFSNPHQKFLSYNNTQIFDSEEETTFQEILALRNALAISEILGRTLILPYFHCVNGARCNILHHMCLRSLHKDFPNYRENQFLKHPKVPNVVKASLSKLYLITTDLDTVHVSSDFLTIKKCSDVKGATSNEILDWFGNEKASVLQFESLYRSFYQFDDSHRDKLFNKKVERSFKYAGYVQRNNSIFPINLSGRLK